jgi:S-adenosylmethionine hydrolase
VPERAIAYVDGYGNLKTTLRAEDLRHPGGTPVRLRIGGREHEAIAGDGTFAVAEGRMALAPGSSGWTGREGREVRWLEVFLRGGNAWEAFGRPSVGDPVEVAG